MATLLPTPAVLKAPAPPGSLAQTAFGGQKNVPTPNIDPMGSGHRINDAVAPPTPFAQPPAVAGSPYGVNSTPIDPAHDLRSSQITPGYDPRLATSQGQSDTARSTLASTAFSPYVPVSNSGSPYTAEADALRGQATGALGSGVVKGTDTSAAQGLLNRAATSYGAAPAMGGVNYGADTTGARARLSASLANLQGPDRSKLAADAFQLMQEQAAPGRAIAERGVGQKAGAWGRLGAGQTTNELDDLSLANRRADDLAARGLAGDAAAQTLADRLGITSAIGNATGELAGIDQNTAQISNSAAAGNASIGNARGAGLANLASDQLALSSVPHSEGVQDRAYGLDRSTAFSGLAKDAFNTGTNLRDEARAEGSRKLAYDTANLNKNSGIYNDLAGGEQQVFNQGQSTRNEIRGERSNEQDQAQQGINNGVTQAGLEDQLLNSGAARGTNLTQLYNQLGYGGQGDLSNVLGGQAGQDNAQSNAAFGGVGDLLAQYMAGQGAQQGAVNYATNPNAISPKVMNTASKAPKSYTLAKAPTQFPTLNGALPYGGI